MFKIWTVNWFFGYCFLQQQNRRVKTHFWISATNWLICQIIFCSATLSTIRRDNEATAWRSRVNRLALGHLWEYICNYGTTLVFFFRRGPLWQMFTSRCTFPWGVSHFWLRLGWGACRFVCLCFLNSNWAEIIISTLPFQARGCIFPRLLNLQNPKWQLFMM